jgi:hypothetical protein
MWAIGMVGVAVVGGFGVWQSGVLTKERSQTAASTATSSTRRRFLGTDTPKLQLQRQCRIGPGAGSSAATTRRSADVAATGPSRATTRTGPCRPGRQGTTSTHKPCPKRPQNMTPPVQPTKERTRTRKRPLQAQTSAPRAQPAPPDLARFDGAWQIQINCQRPSGGTTQQSLDVVAKVNQGVLHGETGQEGEPGWRQIHGQIRNDGHANLVAKVIPNENVRRKRNAPMTTIEFPAVFQETSGRGQTQQPRTCSINFSKT